MLRLKMLELSLPAHHERPHSVRSCTRFSSQKGAQKPGSPPASENGQPAAPAIPLLSVVGERARMEGKFDIADSIQVECEVGGEMNVGGKLVIGEKGVVNANVQTVDAIIMGSYQGNMIRSEERRGG